MTWSHFKSHFHHYPELGFSLDLSRMPFPEGYFAAMEPRMQQAFASMQALESGAIANPDEQRMVGHYWLRAPRLAPTLQLANEITDTLAAIKAFTAKVHAGEIAGAGGKFKNLLVIGIGGSA
ncbi:MAG: glucose-6-phosphate isomerase, partial [Opitutaceae bacterium]|nr:glucose-6-phosphate isomerase [Opitutaceae bacterium]